MTTVIRNGNMTYADSCVTMHSGSRRTTRYSASKLLRHHSNKCVIGLAGSVCSEADLYPEINATIDDILVALKDISTFNASRTVHRLSKYIRDMTDVKRGEYIPEYGGLTVFVLTKQYTVVIDIEDDGAYGFIYNGNTVLCIGSGGAVYTGLVDLDISMDEKLKAIFNSDVHSGGVVTRVDLNKLEDL